MKNILIIALLIMASGCSTLMNGTDQVVLVDNYYNQKERVKIHTPYSTHIDTMPARVHISSGVQGGEYSVHLEGECFNQQSVNIPKSLRGAYWLNMFNIVGFFVDYSTGAMWAYPEKVHVPIDRYDSCADEVAKN